MDARTPSTPLLGETCCCNFVERMIPHRNGTPALEVIEAWPEEPAVGAPILLLHGAFGGAWIWREIFMPYFACRGRVSIAVSVRGHGKSEGRADLRTWQLSHYLDDVSRGFAELREPPVVIAHSLGGLLAQMLIGREDMRALVLLSSLPPEGLMLESPRLAFTDTALWLDGVLGSLAQNSRPMELAAHKLLFSEGLPRQRVVRYSAQMTAESPRVLAEAHLPGPIAPAFLFGIPVMVWQGAEDRLVLQPSSLRTALYHSGEHHKAEGQGHFLQLDIGAEAIARDIMKWVDRIGA
jgi:pimeloyl-ACP methyl ester carboxylesterase